MTFPAPRTNEHVFLRPGQNERQIGFYILLFSEGPLLIESLSLQGLIPNQSCVESSAGR